MIGKFLHRFQSTLHRFWFSFCPICHAFQWSKYFTIVLSPTLNASLVCPRSDMIIVQNSNACTNSNPPPPPHTHTDTHLHPNSDVETSSFRVLHVFGFYGQNYEWAYNTLPPIITGSAGSNEKNTVTHEGKQTMWESMRPGGHTRVIHLDNKETKVMKNSAMCKYYPI